MGLREHALPNCTAIRYTKTTVQKEKTVHDTTPFHAGSMHGGMKGKDPGVGHLFAAQGLLLAGKSTIHYSATSVSAHHLFVVNKEIFH